MTRSAKEKKSNKKVVLAYSGGLDTSVIVPWLKENYGCEVVCFCANVGQGDQELDMLEQKALASGASMLIAHDLREEFASDYLFPLIKSGAIYERKYLLGTSVARPLIVRAFSALVAISPTVALISSVALATEDRLVAACSMLAATDVVLALASSAAAATVDVRSDMDFTEVAV